MDVSPGKSAFDGSNSNRVGRCRSTLIVSASGSNGLRSSHVRLTTFTSRAVVIAYPQYIQLVFGGKVSSSPSPGVG